MTDKKNNLGHRQILEWPMTQEQLNGLGETKRVSPRVGNDHGYSPVSKEQFELEMNELPELRVMVEKGIWPTDYMKKHVGSGDLSEVLRDTLGTRLRDPRVAADTVQMDHPFDIWDLVVEPWAKANNIPYRTPLTHKGNPFVEGVLYRLQAHTAIAKALNKAFDVKDAFGTCRPEEVFDASIVRFPTPNHGEEPAGHGAFCGAAYAIFKVIFNPTLEQDQKVKFATRQFAHFRFLSAMHKPSSNELGWKIGYESV